MQLKRTYASPWPLTVTPAQGSQPPPVVIPPSAPRPFLTVSEAAPLLRLSDMTLYRAIHAGQFPAVRIRGRLIIPTRAIDEMIAAAMTDGAMVDAADWVPDDTRPAS
jgi:excisionase family DNA binding protein